MSSFIRLPGRQLSPELAFDDVGWGFAFTPAQENLVLLELGHCDPAQRARWLRHISQVAYSFHSDLLLEIAHGNDAREIKRAATAEKSIRAARNALDQLGPEAYRWAYIGDDEHDYTGQMLRQLDQVADNLARFMTHPAKKGRQALSALEGAIRGLAIVYKAMTGKSPGYSSPHVVGATGLDRSNGPFVRFCEKTLMLVDPLAGSSIRSTVRKVLRQGKKSHPEWPIVPPDGLI